MKIIGEGVKDYTLDPKKKLILLGISNWATVRNNHLLLVTNDKKRKYIEVLDETNERSKYAKKKDACLQKDHTHFILVDKCQLNTFGGEIELRNEIEKEISKYDQSEQALTISRKSQKSSSFYSKPAGSLNQKVPIVLIVIGGGPNTFKTCLEAVKNESPVLFIEGSGRCADIFSDVYKIIYSKNKETQNDDFESCIEPAGYFDEEFKSDILKKVSSTIKNLSKKTDDEKDKQAQEILDTIIATFNYYDLLSVYTQDKNSDYSTDEIDEAILFAILKSQKHLLKEEITEATKNAQLKLAITWDRVDMAKKFILNENQLWETEQLHELMYIAIKHDKIDFVKLFLEHGFVLSKFLTNRCLLKLYNDVSFF
jgi:hypothetical protein